MKISEEAARCLLCNDPKCTSACPNGFDPGRAVRAVRFENSECAGEFADKAVCASCAGFCEKACIHYDSPVRIKEVVSRLPENEYTDSPDLCIDFMGVKCENPFFLSSSIVAGNYEMCARAFEMGWAGAVYKTIGFIKPEETSPRFDAIRKESTPFIGFKNLEQISDHSLEENLKILRRLKKDFPTKVLIVSIMGSNDNEWSELARLSEDAGADIIECNFSCPQMVGEGLGSDVGINPELVYLYTKAVKKGTNLPVLAKMTPNITSMIPPAVKAVEAGADGLAAINTIKSIMNVNLENFSSSPDVCGKSSVGGYSGKAVKPIALRFINEMKSSDKLKDVPISGMGGIETWYDAAEFISLGCSTVQVTTAVMQYGYRIVEDMIDGLKRYMSSHNFSSINDFIGVAEKNIIPADDLDRSYICFPRFDREKCIGCERCYVSCYDGGHQAIKMNSDRKPVLDGKKCVGCHLCKVVCPVNAIDPGKKVSKLALTGH